MTSTLTIQARFAVLALQRLLTGLPVAAACFLAGPVVASAQTPPAVAARAAGRGFPTPDGYIAAIAAAHGFSVATRDVAPFQAAGLKVVNPWHGG